MRDRLIRVLGSRSAVADVSHVFLLAFLGVAYPLLRLLASNAEFFVARRSDGLEIVFLLTVLVVGVPVVLLVPQLLARLAGKAARRTAHLVTVAVLGATIALPAVNNLTHLHMVFAVLLALVIGAAAAVAYARSPGGRAVLTAFSPFPFVYAIVLLLASPISQLLDSGLQPRALGARPTSSPPVLFLVLDEFPETSMMTADHQVDRARLPNLAQFAQTATWFRNATTVHEATEWATPAILTGTEPPAHEHRLPVAASYPRNLFTLLGGSYAMDVHESLTQLCPTQICGKSAEPKVPRSVRNKSLLEDVGTVFLHTIAAADLVKHLPDISSGWGGFVNRRANTPAGSGAPVLQQLFSGLLPHQGPLVETLVKTLNAGPDTKPTLHYAHLYLPHRPWRYLPSGHEYDQIGAFLDNPRKDPVEERERARQALQRHLLQVGYLDRQLGRIFDALKANGTFDQSLIVLTADHGAAFAPGSPLRIAGPSNLAEIGDVTMFVKYPKQHAGVIDDRLAQTIDLVPTVLDVLGIPPPHGMNGVSLRAPAARTATRDRILHTRLNNPNTHGGDLSLRSTEAGRDQAIARIHDTFGGRQGTVDLFASGRFRSLAGTPAPAAPPDAGRDGFRLAMNGLDAFAAVDPRAAVQPSHLTGRVSGPAGTVWPLDLAFAVNGTVVATAPTGPGHGDSAEVDVILPDTAFRPGRNAVQVLLATGDPVHPTLRTLGGAATATFRVDTTSSSARLVRGDGVVFPLVADAGLTGTYEQAYANNAGYTVIGYALDPTRLRLVDNLVVCAGQRCFFSGVTSVERPSVADSYHSEAVRNSGFEVLVSQAALGFVPFDSIRVYAIIDGHAQRILAHGK